MAPDPPVPTVFIVTVIDGASTFICIGAICTFGLQTPEVTGAVGTATITAADSIALNLQVKMGWKIKSILAYNPATGSITVDMQFTSYLVYTYDSGAGGWVDTGGNPPLHPYLGMGAGNCPLRSHNMITVDDSSGTIPYESDIDFLNYSITVNYVTGNISVTGTPPPDGTTIMIPTA